MYTGGMPPTPQETHQIDVSHMLPEHATKKRSSGAGPVVGIFIVVALLIVGGLYFWGAQLNRDTQQPLPLIPGDTSTS